MSPETDAVEGGPTAEAEPHGAAFWSGLVVGGAIVAYGIRGVVTAPGGVRPADLARWVVGADLLHDLLLLPIVIVVGAVLLRCTPARLRPPVRFGLVATGVALLIGWAPWRGYGAAIVPDNRTVQPLDYTTAILTVVGGIWAAAGLWALIRCRRSRATRVGRGATGVQVAGVESGSCWGEEDH